MNGKSFLIGAVIILIIGSVVFLSGSNKSYSWHVSLNDKGYQPYDLALLKDVFKASYKDSFEYITRSSQFEQVMDSGSGTIFYADSKILLSSDHNKKLMEFIARGNTAFISSDITPENLIDSITGIDLNFDYGNDPMDNFFNLAAQDDELEVDDYLYLDDEDDEERYSLVIIDTVAQVKLKNVETDFTFKFFYKDTVRNFDWFGIPKNLYEDYNTYGGLEIESLLNDSLADMISMNHGDGKLVVHFNPIMFSNIYFKEDFGFEYAQSISNYFSGNKLYFNKKYNYASKDNPNAKRENIKSPLTFILANPSLKWTLYAIILLSLIYFLFSLKRRFPMIPYFETPRNTSIKYVRALSSFYKSSKDHGNISQEMMKNFEHFIRKRYHVLLDNDQKEKIQTINKVSGLSEESLKHVYDLNTSLKVVDHTNSKKLVKLYEALESLYKNAK